MPLTFFVVPSADGARASNGPATAPLPLAKSIRGAAPSSPPPIPDASCTPMSATLPPKAGIFNPTRHTDHTGHPPMIYYFDQKTGEKFATMPECDAET